MCCAGYSIIPSVNLQKWLKASFGSTCVFGILCRIVGNFILWASCGLKIFYSLGNHDWGRIKTCKCDSDGNFEEESEKDGLCGDLQPAWAEGQTAQAWRLRQTAYEALSKREGVSSGCRQGPCSGLLKGSKENLAKNRLTMHSPTVAK